MWLKDFFESAFSAAGPLGLAAFAMVIIVALVAIVVAVSNGSRALVGAFGTLALVAVVAILVFNQLYPQPKLEKIPVDKPAPAPAPSPVANSARWFDTGLQADWGGYDRFYGAGEKPVYEANGLRLCDDDLLGRVVTCWSSRAADPSSMAPGVPTNIVQRRNDWCAYKDSIVTLAKKPDGGAPPGRVYACAHSISPDEDRERSEQLLAPLTVCKGPRRSMPARPALVMRHHTTGASRPCWS
jgi:hypothetical protein